MNFINAISGWLILLLGLALSIGLHELGHLLPAKKFGVKVTKYMIGFGPTIFSRKKGETEYGIKAIPLGGYIQMVGMLPPSSSTQPVKGWKKLEQFIIRLGKHNEYWKNVYDNYKSISYNIIDYEDIIKSDIYIPNPDIILHEFITYSKLYLNRLND